MNIYYFLQRYLDKLNQVEFIIKWEHYVHFKIKRFFTAIVFIWLLSSVGFGYIINLLVGPYIGFGLMIIFSIYCGYVLFIQTVKFLAVNNTRYIDVKMKQDESGINYDNIVG
ncbi:MAG: hypothetical protein KAH16_03710 [Candidatus Izimaplasma sp.]|nr:hypothetical protein [Candidatus Izimaplasma bacterium]